MDLEQFQIQTSWPTGRNPVMPALLTAVRNQDEIPVAIEFVRDTAKGRALRTMRQAAVDVRPNGGHLSDSCGHRYTIGELNPTIKQHFRFGRRRVEGARKNREYPRT
jgi:hypothetical protein